MMIRTSFGRAVDYFRGAQRRCRSAPRSCCRPCLRPPPTGTSATSSVPVVGDVLDEALVDLPLGDRKAAEQRQGRVAGGEIVHGDANAEPVDVLQQSRDPLGVAHRCRFGELDLEHRWIDSDDAAIVRSATALAHGLGMTVVSGGVETPSQLHLQARHGCNVEQGLLSSPPLPADEVRGRLAARGTT